MSRVLVVLIGLLVQLSICAAWVVGWVLAQGFWSTFGAVVFPPWGWYLIAERVLRAWGIA